MLFRMPQFQSFLCFNDKGILLIKNTALLYTCIDGIIYYIMPVTFFLNSITQIFIQILQKNPVQDCNRRWNPPPPIGLTPHFFDFDNILIFFSFQYILFCNTICNICYECLTMGSIMFLFLKKNTLQNKQSIGLLHNYSCVKKMYVRQYMFHIFVLV